MKDQEIQRLLKQTRKDQDQGALVTSHLDDSGLAKPLSGDDQAPFVKELPFVTELTDYWTATPLDTSDLIVGPTIDVQNWRMLIIYLTFTPNATGSVLSLIPLAAGALDAVLQPIGVINPTITAVTIAGATGFGSRTMYKTEIRTPATTAAFETTLAFDVTAYSAYQFQALQIGAGDEPGLIDLKYALSM